MSQKYWIGKAIEKEGALRDTVQRKYGKKGFTRRGTIKVRVLRKLAKEKGKTGRRARLAITLRGLRKSKGRGKGVQSGKRGRG